MAYEFKWDGLRAAVMIDQGRVTIASRTDRDASPTYPELTALADLLAGRRVILDGEIVALDPAVSRRFPGSSSG